MDNVESFENSLHESLSYKRGKEEGRVRNGNSRRKLIDGKYYGKNSLTAAIFHTQVRKTPYITEAHSVADQRQ